MTLPSPHVANAMFSDIVNFAQSAQACGYFASLLVFATFWMQRMVPLRLVAIYRFGRWIELRFREICLP